MYPADDVHVWLATLLQQIRVTSSRMQEQVQRHRRILDERGIAHPDAGPRVDSRFRRMSSSSSSSADSGEIMG